MQIIRLLFELKQRWKLFSEVENRRIKIESLLLSLEWKKIKDYKYHSTFISAWQSSETGLFALGTKLVIFLKSEWSHSVVQQYWETKLELSYWDTLSLVWRKKSNCIDFLMKENDHGVVFLSLPTFGKFIFESYTFLHVTCCQPHVMSPKQNVLLCLNICCRSLNNTKNMCSSDIRLIKKKSYLL